MSDFMMFHPGAEMMKETNWFVGSENSHRVARAILKYGPISRTSLASMQGLSLGAVSRIASDLIHEGVVEESLGNDAELMQSAHDNPADMNVNRRGRPQTGLQVKADGHTFVGVHVQHGNVEMVAVDALCQVVAPTKSALLKASSLGDVCHQIGILLSEYVVGISPRPTKIALSLHGLVSSGRSSSNAGGFESDQAVDCVNMLRDSCGIESILVDDLDSLLVYQEWFGTGPKVSRLAAVMIGADVSFSTFENGNLVSPEVGMGNAIGHIPLDSTGPRCASGHQGCSQCLTCDSIAEEYSHIIGKVCSYAELEADVHAGIAQARRFLDRIGVRVGILLATIATFALPDELIVGGAVASLLNRNSDSIQRGINWFRNGNSSELHFEIVDTSAGILARAAAAEGIVRYLG
ncbi:MAG: ROK family protein [Bifidobacterium sp.]|jgi:predicted NBD/HSP70 family sugar kinase|nr:ROK family protein [Bifidobacterium sp.]MCH4174259.1 ROK family protein [Bifidobacterium sp.]